MLTLAIGDLFIPDRSIDIPAKFHKLLAPNPQSIPSNPKISNVLCLGNITNDLDTLNLLFNISPNFHMVKGEFDDVNLLTQQLNLLGVEGKDLIQNYKILKVDNLKIGFTNGSLIVPKNDPLSLSSFAREIDVDILIYGGTHKVDAYVLDGKFFVNPGSGSGAFNFDWQAEDGESDEEEGGEEQGEEQEQDEPQSEKNEEEIKTETKTEETETNPETEKTEQTESESKDQVQDSKEEPSVEAITTDLEKTTLSPQDQIKLDQFTNNPSFCLLETHDSSCTLYIYTYLDDEVKVDKVTYHKD